MPDTSKLEKLNRELEKSEKKLRKAINDEKALRSPKAPCRRAVFCGLAIWGHLALQAVPRRQVS